MTLMKVQDNRILYRRRHTTLIHVASQNLSRDGLALNNSSLNIVAVSSIVVLAGELLKSLAGCFGNEECGTAAEKHKEGKDLEDMVEPRGSIGLGGTASTETGNGTLANDGANLARGSRNTVRCRTVAGREDLAGNNKGGGVGSKVEEELGNDVDGEEAVGGEVMVSKAHDNEENGKNDETSHLDGLATESINGGHRNPVAGNGTSTDDDDVADSSVVEELVNVLDVARGGRVANGLENSTVVQRKAVEGDIETKPRTSSSEEEQGILELAIVVAEIAEAGLGDLEALFSLLVSLGPGNLIGIALMLALHVSLDIVVGLLDITSDVESVARGLGDGKTV